MPPLYVVEQGAKIHKEQRRLVIKKDEQELNSIPLIKVSQVLIFGNVGLTTPALTWLMSQDIDVIFLTHDGRYRGRVMGQTSAHSKLRRLQYRRADNAAFAVNTARAIVRAKLKNSRTLLMRYQRRQPNEALPPAIERLVDLIDRADRVHTVDSSQGGDTVVTPTTVLPSTVLPYPVYRLPYLLLQLDILLDPTNNVNVVNNIKCRLDQEGLIMTITYAVHQNHLSADGEIWRGVVKHNQSVDLEMVVERMLNRGSTITRADALAVLNEYYAAIGNLLLEGAKVTTPGAVYSVSIKGNFDGPDDSFDAARHAIDATVSPGNQVRKQVREQAAVQRVEATKPKPNPLELIDLNSGQRNSTATPGSIARIAGHRLKYDLEDAAQGIFFTAQDNGNTPVRVEDIGKNSAGELIFIIPAELTAGSYTVSVKAKFGNEDIRTGLLDATLSVAA